MTKFKLKKIFVFIPAITAFFTYMCVNPILDFQNYLQSKGAPKLSEQEIFLNIMGPNGNFINPIKIVVLYLIIFVLCLFFLFPKDEPYVLIRMKSRKIYTGNHLFNVFIFSLVFVFLIETVNVITAFFVFDYNVIENFHFLQYSLLDLLSLFLFYIRVGIVLYIIGVISTKMLAPFITFAVYLIEFFSSYFLESLNGIWLPYKDAVTIIYLLIGNMQPHDVISVIFRGIILNSVLIFIAYFLFEKKDVLGNEAK